MKSSIEQMNVVVLSPHRDDAAFSCGLLMTLLLHARAAITVVNICTISDYAPYLATGENNRVEQVSAARRREDLRFAGEVTKFAGVSRDAIEIVDLGWQDAPLRLAIPTPGVLDGTPLDESEVAKLVNAFKAFANADAVFAPLALGGHIDHRLVREAAVQAFAKEALVFYEDLPYACRMSPAERHQAAERALPASFTRWAPGSNLPSSLKMRLVMCYPSQIDSSVAEEMEQDAAPDAAVEPVHAGTKALLHLTILMTGQQNEAETKAQSLIPPDISVLMTVLNTERYLAEAIESVLAQQTTRRWELLIVDDGSTDDSLRIADSYAAKHPDRIRVLQHAGGANRGISASRNLALQHARGSIIAFLDSDDVWLPHHLETQSAVLHRLPEIGMVYASAERWVDTTAPFDEDRSRAAWWGENYIPPLVPPGERTGALDSLEFLRWFLKDESLVPCICTVLVRASIIRAVGGFCRAFRGAYDDQAFHAKAALYGQVFVNDVCIARYRRHDLSCCATSLKNQEALEKERRRFLVFLRRLLKLRGLSGAQFDPAADANSEVANRDQHSLVPASL